MNDQVPLPVTFNPLKHHAGYVMQMLTFWKQTDIKIIADDLLSVGENLTDLYLGKLTVVEICTSCLKQLPNTPILTRETFRKWLSDREYRKVILNDGSEWVIREGTDHERFVHIHPAKHSPFTVRIRATTLKTVITLLAYQIFPGESSSENLDAVNLIRKNINGLSPVKSLDSKKGILKMWKLFTLMSRDSYRF